MHNLRKRPPANRRRPTLRTQPRSATIRALLRREELRERLPRFVVVALGVATAQIVQDAFEGFLHRIAHTLKVIHQRNRFVARAVEQLLAEGLG